MKVYRTNLKTTTASHNHGEILKLYGPYPENLVYRRNADGVTYFTSDSKPNGVSSFEFNLQLDKDYEFISYINPVTSKKGRRTPKKDETEFREWFNKKTGDAVTVDNLKILDTDKELVKKKKAIFGVLVKGTFKVKDMPRAEELLRKGIGSSQTWGYGMIDIYKESNF